MTTTPEQLCTFIMAKAMGEKVEVHGADGNWYGIRDAWSTGNTYRIVPKPKKKIVKRQAVLINRGKHFIPDTLYENEEQVKASWGNDSFVQWYGEPVEIEVEDE